MKRSAFLFGLVLTLVLMFGAALAQPALAQDTHWGYEGEDGPTHWGDLDPAYKVCAAGTEQSPIDIPAGAPVNPANIAFNYMPGDLKISNNGHTIKVDYAAGSSIVSGGKTYKLVQYHFHAKSEHTVAGQSYPMELHLVHQADDGQLAVVGVLLKEGAANAAYASTLSNMSAQANSPTLIAGATVDAAALLPADRSYYRYNGSLTTPPCSEGVQWHVLKNPVELSAAQISAFTAIFSDDARPVQPLNSRTFLVSGGAQPGMPSTGGNGFVIIWPLLAVALISLLTLGLGLTLRRNNS